MRHRLTPHNSASLLAGVDPRIRMLAAMLLLALVVSSANAGFPWLIASICLPAALVCGMGMRTLCLRLLHPLFIAALFLALKAFSGGGQAVPVQFCGISLVTYHGGLLEGLQVAARIMGAAAVAVLLGQVMTFTETMAALAWLRVPHGLVEVSLFAWRSLFMLYDDAGVVYTAQKNRLGYCGLRRGLRSFGAMAGMLTIRAFDSSHAMTTAMTQRGYDGTLPLLRGARPATAQLGGLLLFALAAATAWKLQN